MTTPNSIIADLNAEIDALRKENSELLAALDEAAFRAAHGECAHVELVCYEAINKAKGSAKC